MCGLLAFIPGHLVMVALHGWDNFASMVTGWKHYPDVPGHGNSSMNHKGVIATALAIIAVAAGWLASAAAAGESGLRCRHSRPAAGPVPVMVALTDAGALFHKPGCRFIHGPVRIESGRVAVASGYTPCTRCWRAGASLHGS